MVKFAILTDLHAEIVHDAERRIDAFVEAANKENVDFAIQLGDFIQPPFKGSYNCAEDKVSPVMKNILENKGEYSGRAQRLLDSFGRLNCPLYHILGNHDLDLYTKEEVMDFWKMPSRYYSFDQGDFHFVVLDASFIKDGDGAVDFGKGNYLKWMFQGNEPFPYVPKEELSWLEEDLKKTDKQTVILSHEGLNDAFINAINHKEIFDVLKNAPHGVRICINGHKHQDLLEEQEGIPVYTVNSISGYSVPVQFAAHRFDAETEEKYPNVQYMCIYEEPLFVIVTIDDEEVRIEGRETAFVEPGPDEVGVHFPNPTIILTPTATSVSIPKN